MSTDKLRVPLTAFEKLIEAMRDANDTLDDLMRNKRIADNLERFDIQRDLGLARDHARMAALLIAEVLRKAALTSQPAAGEA